jgi:hypothetical protein
MGINWNIEWLNHNSQRNYPLADTASGLSVTQDFKIPDSFLVELDLPVPAGLSIDPSRFFIKQIGSYANGYSLAVGYQPTSGTPLTVATALIPKATHQLNTRYALGGFDTFDSVLGKVVIGSLVDINKQPSGIWEFSFEDTRLDPDTIRPILRGVSSIQLVNGLQKTEKLYGPIELIAGTNTQLVAITQPGEPTQIKINFIEGEGSVNECACIPETAVFEPIRTINGKQPFNNNITIIGSDCIEVVPIENGIQLKNTCANPCCNCPELEAVTRELERLQTEANTVKTVTQKLAVSVETMDKIVLASRIGSSCVN